MHLQAEGPAKPPLNQHFIGHQTIQRLGVGSASSSTSIVVYKIQLQYTTHIDNALARYLSAPMWLSELLQNSICQSLNVGPQPFTTITHRRQSECAPSATRRPCCPSDPACQMHVPAFLPNASEESCSRRPCSSCESMSTMQAAEEEMRR